MGLKDLFSRKGIIAAAAGDENVIDVTREITVPEGNIAPLLAAQLAAPPGWNVMDWQWGCLTRTMAMKVPAVRRGVRTIADAVASMPLTRWRGLEELPAGTFLSQPETWRPRAATIRALTEDMIFYPYAWFLVQARDFTGFPLAGVVLDPAFVTVTYEPGTDEIQLVTATYKGREVNPDDLMRFDGPDEGILRLGTLEIMTALKLELAAQTYADPEIPSGVLTNTGEYRLTPDERTALMEQWRLARLRGSTAFLDANLDYKMIQAMPDQLQLVQGREESAAQIARLLNLPPHYVGAKSGDSMTYSTVSAQRRDLVDLSLAPYIQAIDGRLSMSDRNGSPHGQSVRLNRADLLRSDAREDAEIGEILIRSGQSTANEQRARRGLPPLTGPAATTPAPGPATPAQETADAA